MHLTGTNGKGSTARMLSALVAAQGLSVGTYTSPHLERVNERITRNGERRSPTSNWPRRSRVSRWSSRCSPNRRRTSRSSQLPRLRWFAEVAVDAAVVEVGLGGRWDATNVGRRRGRGRHERRPRSHRSTSATRGPRSPRRRPASSSRAAHSMLGETDTEVLPALTANGPGDVWVAGVDFGVRGQRARVRRPAARSPHTPARSTTSCSFPCTVATRAQRGVRAGRCRGVLRPAARRRTWWWRRSPAVQVPGRIEVVGHRPLVLLDGAHNPHGAKAFAGSLAEAFPLRVTGSGFSACSAGRDPAEMLAALGIGAA